MAAVRIPPTLRAEVGGARELEASGSTVAEVIDDLVGRFPALAGQLLQDGELAPFVNVYVGGEVDKAGIVPIQDTMTSLMAIVRAGGFLDTAQMSNVVVLRDGEGGRDGGSGDAAHPS